MSQPLYVAPKADCHQNLHELVASSARAVLHHAEGTTRQERQFLFDVARREYSEFRTIERFADIARNRVKDPTIATSLAEAIRGRILAGHPGLSLSWFDVLRYEGATNQIADEATIEYLLRRDASSRERMIEAHNAQAIASRAVCDLMHGERGR